MSFPHEVIAALPTAASGDKELLRALLTRRFAYCLADDEAASDFVAKDPVSGIPPLNLIQGGTLYAYDEFDSTTAPSAVCLVTSDACRYKSGVIEPPYSVLTYSTTAQPADVDVSDGDTFLLPIGATGADWAGKAGQIAIRVGAKWHFAINPIGRRLYVEDEDRFYYRNDSGVWVTGNGTLAFAANSIPITAIIGAKASFQIKVENQTTNAPPASPVAPVAYIIGPSPTGAWASKAGQLAICLVDGVFTIINPDEGDEVWDKTRSANFVFNGMAWVSSVGAWINKVTVFDLASTLVGSGANAGQAYSSGSPPTTIRGHRRDDHCFLSYAARSTGTHKIRLSYTATLLVNTDTAGLGAPDDLMIAVLRDSETNAIAWSLIPGFQVELLSLNTQYKTAVEISFMLDVADTLAHTYKVAFFSRYGSVANNVVAVQSAFRRTMILEEAA